MTLAFVLAAATLALLALLPLAPALLSGPSPRAWRTTTALGLALPLTAGLLYAQLGRPDAINPPPTNPVQQMVQRLAERLQRTPDDAEGWTLLARAYEQLGRPQDALPAYAQLERLRPDDAQPLSQHAVTLALVQGKGLDGEPEALLQRALRLDPRHVPTLALLGSAAHERGDTAAAVGYWRRVLAEVPADSDIAASLRDSIAKVQVR
ncbi:tetratricopeptide repeat protein [Roseateles sp. NT4]|uniref:tetratricopeptide repeat protein n=1 Tax=Roseateles sp. NT4 TaxID=3453715 RepID=UPI003EEFB1D4